MTSITRDTHGMLLPRTTPAPGQMLWGDAPRRQPIAPLILMAVILLLVAAPTALAGNGSTGNPIKLLREIAASTYELTGLVKHSNDSLAKIDSHSRSLVKIEKSMGSISTASAGMERTTTALNTHLGTVSADVRHARTTLHAVSGKLSETGAGMGKIASGVDGSLAETNKIVGEFGTIGGSITGMQRNLRDIIGRMGNSAPLTKDFANNETRVAIAGGNGAKYGVPNFAANTRVMSVMLPMIKTLQEGGPLPARKDSHTASNILVDTALKLQVPDGTNVVVNLQPYDGFYGLPPASFFIERQVHGI
ncbi:MAG: hypothetical protein H7287_00115 [Thermoleophilia bacterium]|nr:hypothetical protein [Thermoleophilia bacterium]